VPRDDAVTTIAGFPAALTVVPLYGSELRLYVVPNLERLVDRAALLRGDVEPPYWAYLWSGSRCLADYLTRWTDLRGRRVLEIGCGLGLAGMAAARAGADLVFVDGALPALAFVRASLRVNGLTAAAICTDYRLLASGARFDCILAAEVAYEPARFADLAATLARHLAPGGIALIGDGFRTDTRLLYRAFTDRGLTTRSVELRVVEESRPARVRLTEARGRPGLAPRM
jgi:predicted nicotinamide N-methyase